MPVTSAYLAVIVIWSTTPLAIKWSGEDVGFLFGVAARMVIGLALVWLLVAVSGTPVPRDRASRATYGAAGGGIYVAMLLVYWSAQLIPSGWISVLFGMTPIFTGAFASIWLGEDAFAPLKVLGMALGTAGLLLIFYTGLEASPGAAAGVGGVLAAALVHSLSSVWVKRIGARLHGLAVTAGSLTLAVPLFVATWLLLDGRWPQVTPARSIAAILYLGVFGSAIGFALYYYVLRQVAATRVAVVTLVTPVSALMLGSLLNREPIGVRVWAGTALILAGLLSFQLDLLSLRRARLSAGRSGRAPPSPSGTGRRPAE
ncbi:MAG: DMT family transporter [Chromatiales bacterium]|jgi:drug/metabolite transporter (DMT)-like permease